jgi:hypothetical protein
MAQFSRDVFSDIKMLFIDGESFERWRAEKFPHVNSLERQKLNTHEDEVHIKNEVAIMIHQLCKVKNFKAAQNELYDIQDRIRSYSDWLKKQTSDLSQYGIDQSLASKKILAQEQQIQKTLADLFSQLSATLKDIQRIILILEYKIKQVDKLIDETNSRIEDSTNTLINNVSKFSDSLPKDNKYKEALADDITNLANKTITIGQFNANFQNVLNNMLSDPSRVDSRLNDEGLIAIRNSVNSKVSSIQNDNEKLASLLNARQVLVQSQSQYRQLENQISGQLDSFPRDVSMRNVTTLNISVQDLLQREEKIAENFESFIHPLSAEDENLLDDIFNGIDAQYPDLDKANDPDYASSDEFEMPNIHPGHK